MSGFPLIAFDMLMRSSCLTALSRLARNRVFALAVLSAAGIAGSANAAGVQRLNLPMDMNGPGLTGAIWYPCAAPAADIKMGSATIPGVLNCPVPEGRHPLIVLSHGSAGSFLSHHDTAAALADAGFVVAAINHVGDNAQDRSRQGYLSIFSTRPREMRRLIDYMTGAWPQKAQVDVARIGVFGFSRGGYTALVLAGGKPDFSAGLGICQDAPTLPMCRDIASGKIAQQPYVSDERVKAVVVADPLNAFPGEALKAVKVPVQLWASALGGDGVTPASVEAVREGLMKGLTPGMTQELALPPQPAPPALLDFQPVNGAGHFAFLAPCSPSQAEALPAICQDAAGFDRAQFHQDFNAKVTAFFKNAMP